MSHSVPDVQGPFRRVTDHPKIIGHRQSATIDQVLFENGEIVSMTTELSEAELELARAVADDLLRKMALMAK